MSSFLDDGDVRLIHGDVREVLPAISDASVDCIVTSPPYWQLRDYGYEGQIGLEPTIEGYVETIVGVFRELRRVLAAHGTCWLNLGDSFAHSTTTMPENRGRQRPSDVQKYGAYLGDRNHGLKPKDLCLIPFRVALALQADGWWIRQRNIWAKPNPMPESVRDRTTSAAEEVFHLTKIGAGYYYDAEAVREAWADDRNGASGSARSKFADPSALRNDGGVTSAPTTAGRNLRNVWTIATEPTPEAHFATFPLKIVETCLLAGCPRRVCRECGEPSRRVVEREPMVVRPGPGRLAKQRANGDLARTAIGGTVEREASVHTIGWTDCGHDAWRPGIVLDPFIGSGKTAQQARRMGLHAIGIDGSEEYLGIAKRRLAADRARSWTADGDRPVVHDDQLAMEVE